MDDLYPTDFEALIGSLIVLMRDEKDVEAKISVNSEDIKRRVQNEIVVTEPTESATPIVSSEPDLHPPTGESPELDVDQMSASDSAPLAKKLFKQVALVTHPDKIKDEKLNKLFLLARKAHDSGDILTLLFITSKCTSKNLTLAENEMDELKTALNQRQTIITQKKDSVTYKWHTYSEDVKKILINKIV
jgi:hypothetical protein